MLASQNHSEYSQPQNRNKITIHIFFAKLEFFNEKTGRLQ